MKNKLMTNVTTVIETLTTVIETLEAWEEYYTESYNEKLSECLQLKDSEKIKQNECDRAYMQGRIAGIKTALSMLK
jgi:hypothetical protein